MTAPILITGGTGQLGVALAEAAAALGLVLDRVDRPAFDFDRPGSIAQVFAASAPALVVNTAAYTAVDAAEDDADAAFRANHDGPAELARLCEAAGIPLIHISTDYVFDGLKGAPYVETDATSPQGVYGASKLAGEAAVLSGCSRAVVVRTSWLYSPTGKNFVRTMLAAGQRNGELRVVADQTGCPTSAPDLARAILAMAARLMGGGWEDRWAGVYHAAGTGGTSWHEVATATFEEAARHGQAMPTLVPIATAEWPTRAKRPPDSRLDCGRLAAVFGLRLPPWRDGLARTVGAIFAGRPR
jgi:dTDP-4-dehydrorhamnose reductase